MVPRCSSIHDRYRCILSHFTVRCRLGKATFKDEALLQHNPHCTLLRNITECDAVETHSGPANLTV
jgi:hypothetical protein